MVMMMVMMSRMMMLLAVTVHHRRPCLQSRLSMSDARSHHRRQSAGQ